MADRMGTVDMRTYCAEVLENVTYRGEIEQCLRSADPYYWGPQPVAMMDGWSTIPPLTLAREMLPDYGGFFWFSKPFVTDPIRYGSGNTGRLALKAIAWQYYYDRSRRIVPETPEGCPGIAFYPFGDIVDESANPKTHIYPLSALMWNFGETDEQAVDTLGGADEAAKFESRCFYRILAASLVFINQKILTTTAMRADRATRRRLNVERFKDEPLIRVVEMRRREHQSTTSGEHDAVEWACQWVVSGHWRQQWYPSLNVYQPKWIMPYVKGPDDKPLKPPRAKVFAVVR